MANHIDFHDFRKEEIKSRMVRRAAEFWGYQENEIDAFDPLVTMLLEACSVEFEKIADEVENTRFRVLERLASLMNPEIADIMRPAHAILQTRSVDPFTIIMPHEQFYYKKPVGMGINTDYYNNEIYFSPIYPFRIFDGRVRFLGSSQGLFKVDKSNFKIPLNARNQRNQEPDEHRSLWLGLELNHAIEGLEGLSFFFDWLNEPKKDIFYDTLNRAEWFLDDIKLETQVGLFPEYPELMSLENEYDSLRKIEVQLKLYYEKFFVTIQRNRDLKFKDYERKTYPEAFVRYFGNEVAQQMKDHLVWLEIRFPHELDINAFRNLGCTINSFPVMNRKLNKLTYSPQENLNIIPLESEEPFLAVKSITDDRNTTYKFTPFIALDKLETNTYTLRQQGVSRFDNRNAKELLYYVLEMLHDESKAFSAMDTGFLAETILQINQHIANIEQKLQLSQLAATQKAPIPFVVIKPQSDDDNLYIEFWTCDGEMANRIPAGPILPYSDTFLQKDEVYLLTNTFGGADRLRETDKINQFKQNLLTRGRLVTLEDIKAACWAMAGEKIREIRVSKNFMTSHSPDAGVIRCILIELVPVSTRDFNIEEWENTAGMLRVSLESRSAMNLPYYIVIGN